MKGRNAYDAVYIITLRYAAEIVFQIKFYEACLMRATISVSTFNYWVVLYKINFKCRINIGAGLED